MPTKNMTIDNINPLIDYSPKGAWSEGNISDPYFPKSELVGSCQHRID
jgi:hypothetical protein